MNRPWFFEDNKVNFEADGLKCAMRRGPLGSWCGYVAVGPDHPWFGKTYHDTIKPTADMLGPRDSLDHGALDLFIMALSTKRPEEELSLTLAVRVHGGLTYSANHEPFGEPDGLWWFGFDCAHAGDLIPGMESTFHELKLMRSLVYRDQAYVVSECQSLAAQLVRIK